MSKYLLVVFGATGNQGGSVANYVLSDPELSKQYSVRAITRNASNPAAKALQEKGAEIIEADMDQPSTLPAALSGAHTVFAVTNTTYTSNTREIQAKQAKALCETAVSQGTQYIIWSSMSHPAKISSGKLKNVAHFDVKAEIETYIRGLPVKSAFYAPGSYMQNFFDQMAPQPAPANDGTYVVANLCSSDTQLPLIDVTDTGKWVGAILAEPEKYEGKFLAAAERLYSFKEITEIMSRVSGKTVVYQQVPDEVFKGWLPEAFREQLSEMMVHIREYGYYGPKMKEEVEWAAKQARGELTTLGEFLKKNPLKLE
ncbi:NAD(P)-binding protein [Zopfia rhizophila CBS 207.26]|uniref:NAD(P)-binding protein n=1 Tax=Zopfia rhizophila CBS 207.26 TaxID=1314779 RepID=A0A6A6E7J9_9PEZI|nr:NAD(P)-binding protein [Zopfia rhizophila CBS 207.26]